MARGVNEAIVDFLRRPVVSVLGDPEDPSVKEAQATLTGWAVGVARDSATRGFLVEKLESALDKVGTLVLRSHLRDHVVTAAQRGDTEEIVKELMEVLKYR